MIIVASVLSLSAARTGRQKARDAEAVALCDSPGAVHSYPRGGAEAGSGARREGQAAGGGGGETEDRLPEVGTAAAIAATGRGGRREQALHEPPPVRPGKLLAVRCRAAVVSSVVLAGIRGLLPEVGTAGAAAGDLELQRPMIDELEDDEQQGQGAPVCNPLPLPKDHLAPVTPSQ